MHVSLTQELEEIVRRKVATGLYSKASEVIPPAPEEVSYYNVRVSRNDIEVEV